MDAVISESRERLFGADGAVDFSALESKLGPALTKTIVTRRWFGSKARTISNLTVADWVRLAPDACLLLAEIAYTHGDADTYAIPLKLVRGSTAGGSAAKPSPPLARLTITPDGESAALVDAMADPLVAARWLEMIAGAETIAGQRGSLVATRLPRFDALRGAAGTVLAPEILAAEQSNSSVKYGDRLILKLFRRVEAGLNPDVEVTSYLTAKLNFAHVPAVAGTLEYRRPGRPAASLAVLQGFVANQGDAWQHTLSRVNEFFTQVTSLAAGKAKGPLPDHGLMPPGPPLVGAQKPLPVAANEWLGAFVEEADRLGCRTAQMHLALATPTDDPEFRSETFAAADWLAFEEATGRLIDETFAQLAERAGALPPVTRSLAERTLKLQEALRALSAWQGRPISGLRTRTHGDYHLGQILWTGADFMIIDFEGEPSRPLAERRLKHSPLRDVAGMLRSFHYAAGAALQAKREEARRVGGGDDEVQWLAPWAYAWYYWSSVAFLRAYLGTYSAEGIGAAFLPTRAEELAGLLDAYLLEKAVYELRYEMNNRPDWLPIPLEAVFALAAEQANLGCG